MIAKKVLFSFVSSFEIRFIDIFFAGIRALIIAKDNNPKWKPARVEDVSHKRVSYFFRPLPNDDELPM